MDGPLRGGRQFPEPESRYGAPVVDATQTVFPARGAPGEDADAPRLEAVTSVKVEVLAV